MSNYRERATGEIKSQGEVYAIFKATTSFSSEVDTYAGKGWDEITGVPMPAPSTELKKVVHAAPKVISGVLTEVWKEVDINSGAGKAAKDAALLAEISDGLAVGARQKRDGLLLSSDHSQLADVPKDKVAWKAYRADLRDIPNQAGFPETIPWPTEPA